MNLPSPPRAFSPVLTVLLLLVSIPTALQASTAKQRLSIEPASQQVAAGDVATVTLVYGSDDPTLAGVAARLHYDSSKLTLESKDLLFATGLAAAQDQPDAGNAFLSQYDDGDPATDRRYIAAWAGVSAGWPGDDTALPLSLLRLRFRVRGGHPTADLVLTGSKCNVCSLETQSATIVVAGSGPVQAPVPTATATPFPQDQPPEQTLSDEPIEPKGRAIEVIPTLSEIGLLLMIAALAGSAFAFLLKQRR